MLPLAVAQGLRSVDKGAWPGAQSQARPNAARYLVTGQQPWPSLRCHSTAPELYTLASGRELLWFIPASPTECGLTSQSLGPRRGHLTVVTQRGLWLLCMRPGSP